LIAAPKEEQQQGKYQEQLLKKGCKKEEQSSHLELSVGSLAKQKALGPAVARQKREQKLSKTRDNRPISSTLPPADWPELISGER